MRVWRTLSPPITSLRSFQAVSRIQKTPIKLGSCVSQIVSSPLLMFLRSVGTFGFWCIESQSLESGPPSREVPNDRSRRS